MERRSGVQDAGDTLYSFIKCALLLDIRHDHIRKLFPKVSIQILEVLSLGNTIWKTIKFRDFRLFGINTVWEKNRPCAP